MSTHDVPTESRFEQQPEGRSDTRSDEYADLPGERGDQRSEEEFGTDRPRHAAGPGDESRMDSDTESGMESGQVVADPEGGPTLLPVDAERETPAERAGDRTDEGMGDVTDQRRDERMGESTDERMDDRAGDRTDDGAVATAGDRTADVPAGSMPDTAAGAAAGTSAAATTPAGAGDPWRDLQGQFVDDPAAAVAEGSRVVEIALVEFRRRAESTDSTEDLRVIFRKLRELHRGLL